MTENRYITNPETGREIRVGGVTFCQLLFSSYDFINEEFVRRETAPPQVPRRHFFNTQTNRLIRAGSRRYHNLFSYLIIYYRFDSLIWLMKHNL